MNIPKFWKASAICLLACSKQHESSRPTTAADTLEPASAFDTPTASTGAKRSEEAPRPTVGSGRANAKAIAASGGPLRAEFTEQPSGVRINIDVNNVAPGIHELRIHEQPDCSAPQNKSMGPLFAPRDYVPGLEASGLHLLGDLGSITVTESKDGRVEVLVPQANLRPGAEFSFLNRSLVLYAGEDSENPGQVLSCVPIRATR